MKLLLRLLALSPVLVATTATADDDLYRFEYPVDFTLRLSDPENTLDYANGTEIDTRSRRASLHWRERYGERVQLGLIGGWSYVTQTDNAATQGLRLEGYHAGLSLDVDLYRSETVFLGLGLSYLYQSVKDKEHDQKVEIDWDEPSAWISAGLRLSGGLWLHGALKRGKIEGQQRLSGIVNRTLAIDAPAENSGALGLELQLPDNGYAGIAGETGFNKGVVVYFGRRY